MVGNAAGSFHNSDDLSFIVGNGEFIERARRAAEKHDYVSRAHIDDIATLQAEAGINDYIRAIIGQTIPCEVFLAILRGRNPQRKPAVVTKSS